MLKHPRRQCTSLDKLNKTNIPRKAEQSSSSHVHARVELFAHHPTGHDVAQIWLLDQVAAGHVDTHDD